MAVLEVGVDAMKARAPLAVAVHSTDPLLLAGVHAQLRGRPEVEPTYDVDRAAVGIVAADDVDDTALQFTRLLNRSGERPVVMVLSRLEDSGLFAGVEAGASGFLRRADAVPERLIPVIQAAARGQASVPPDLVGCLLTRVGGVGRAIAPRAEHSGSSAFASASDVVTETLSLGAREAAVLRLAAEGHETAEIAQILSYSERTVKSVIHDITSRLGLRNRTHAVAFALRHGLI
jgi:DNA-binding NarL/FixJ family response regulator